MSGLDSQDFEFFCDIVAGDFLPGCGFHPFRKKTLHYQQPVVAINNLLKS
jgi:hypothetical protein